MRRTPLFMGFIYTVMGILFTYLAIQSAEENLWNFATIILILVATFDFSVAIRIFLLHKKVKTIQKQNKK